jgi:hypothetical protein
MDCLVATSTVKSWRSRRRTIIGNWSFVHFDVGAFVPFRLEKLARAHPEPAKLKLWGGRSGLDQLSRRIQARHASLLAYFYRNEIVTNPINEQR